MFVPSFQNDTSNKRGVPAGSYQVCRGSSLLWDKACQRNANNENHDHHCLTRKDTVQIEECT